MSHELTGYDHYVEGESIEWAFQINEDGSAKDLSAASVEYEVVPNPGDARSDSIVDDTSGSVTVDVEPASPSHPDAPTDTTGYIEVRIDRGEFSGDGGATYWQRLTVEDSSTGRKVFRGPFPVQQE